MIITVTTLLPPSQVDPEMLWLCKISVQMPDYSWHALLLHERDVVYQHIAAEVTSHVTMATHESRYHGNTNTISHGIVCSWLCVCSVYCCYQLHHIHTSPVQTLVNFPTQKTITTLSTVIVDPKCFYKVRIQALQSLAQCVSGNNDPTVNEDLLINLYQVKERDGEREGGRTRRGYPNFSVSNITTTPTPHRKSTAVLITRKSPG